MQFPFAVLTRERTVMAVARGGGLAAAAGTVSHASGLPMLNKWPAVRDSHECNGQAEDDGGRTAEGARQGARIQQKPRTVVVVDHVVFADAAAAHH